MEARVAEAVRELDLELASGSGGAAEEPPPLELAELPPRSVEVPPPELGRLGPALKRAAKGLAVFAVLAAVAAAAVLFSWGALLRPPAPSTLYTFTDGDGVVHIVDDLEKVPPAQRARAKAK